jgi:hypothetical protein
MEVKMKKQWFLAMIGLALFCVNLGGRGNTVKLLVVTDPPRADVTIWGTHPVHGVSPMNIELPKSFFPYIHNHDCQGIIVDVTASKAGFNLIQQRTVIPIKDKHKRRGRHHSAWVAIGIATQHRSQSWLGLDYNLCQRRSITLLNR